jgi:hypothetical protein
MCAYRNHLKSSDDIVTTYEATRAGFVALALEKNRRATPYVAEALRTRAGGFCVCSRDFQSPGRFGQSQESDQLCYQAIS